MAEVETSGERPALRVTGVVLDTPDPVALGAFYARLLGWPYRTEDPEWVVLRDPRRRRRAQLPARGPLRRAGVAGAGRTTPR